jgi:hypothetical protein
MKKLMLVFIVLIVSQVMFSQEKEAALIAKSFGTGDITTIATFFPSSIDMTIVETEDVFSKAQATQILSQFFKANEPSSFDVQHKGASKGGDYYQIGTLKTKKGQFRVTFYLKMDGEKVYLKRLKIEANEDNF